MKRSELKVCEKSKEFLVRIVRVIAHKNTLLDSLHLKIKAESWDGGPFCGSLESIHINEEEFYISLSSRATLQAKLENMFET